MRTVGELYPRGARATADCGAGATLVCFALAGVWVMYGIDGCVVTSGRLIIMPPLTRRIKERVRVKLAPRW